MKKFNALLIGLTFAFTGCFTQSSIANEREMLWPEGKMPDAQLHQIAEMSDVSEKPGFNPDAHRLPFIEWFEKPEHPNGAVMMLVSGGSYEHCCDVGLIREWRTKLTKLGFQTVNLVYRTPRPKNLPIHQSAWEDGQRAVRLIRSQAKARGFDPEKIGVIGMSAGGHLTCLLAANSLSPAYQKIDALDEIPCHINWAIANAPAYNTMNGKAGGQTRQDGLTVVPTLSDVLKFDAKTCPISFHHGGMDPWTPNGSTLAYRELRKLGVPAELHLYADLRHGPHGFERALEFMRQMNFVGTRGEEVLLMSRYPDNSERDDSKYVKESIWPEGKMPDAQAKQCKPYLEWHFPKTLKTGAIQIIYSGGGYNGNDPNGFEVAPMRRFLNRCGMTVVTMKYRTPRPEGLPKHQSAWEDLQRAIRVVRSQATAKGLDPNRIGIMGSSAGGHLTLMGALSSETPAYEPIDELDQLPCNAQWAIAIYPAYVLTDGADGENKHRGNLDEDVIVPEFKFDKSTCPVCFIHGDADGYSAMGSVKVWEKLRAMGVQSDLHTLAKRYHCFQHKAAPGTGSATWMNRAWEFMSRKGFNAAINTPKDSGTTFARDALAPFIESGELPGAINVFYKDGVQETCCIGYRDVAAKRKIGMDDIFMQCSQTKGFCGVTAAKLVEEGKLNLDDPVAKYLPEFKTLWIYDGESNGVKRLKKAKNALTVRMCLNHTGGFPFDTCLKSGDIRGGGWSGGAPLRQNAVVAANMPILFEPGTNHRYSNTGIDIAAACIEVITGMRWEDYLQKTVLDPLEMKDTGFWPTDEQLDHLIESYTCKAGKPAEYLYEHGAQQRPYNDRTRVFASAGAGLWTTANDQLKFYKMLMNLGLGDNGVRILKEETVKSILATSTRPTDGIFKKSGNSGYSLGFSAPVKDDEDCWFGHGGAWGSNCMVNWHKKELYLWVVQLAGNPRPWNKAYKEAKDEFFKTKLDNSAVDAYTGRMK